MFGRLRAGRINRKRRAYRCIHVCAYRGARMTERHGRVAQALPVERDSTEYVMINTKFNPRVKRQGIRIDNTFLASLVLFFIDEIRDFARM